MKYGIIMNRLYKLVERAVDAHKNNTEEATYELMDSLYREFIVAGCTYKNGEYFITSRIRQEWSISQIKEWNKTFLALLDEYRNDDGTVCIATEKVLKPCEDECKLCAQCDEVGYARFTCARCQAEVKRINETYYKETNYERLVR